MNWLLVIVLAILLFCCIRGWNRGFLRMLYSLISVILLMGLIAYATPRITNFVKENTGVYEKMQEQCSDKIREHIEKNAGDGDQQSETIGFSLPKQFSSYIMDGGETILENTGAYDVVGGKAADLLIAGIAFFAALILALLIVNILGKILDIVNHIPIIKGVNRTLGIFAGALEGFIIIWLIFLFLALIAGTELGTTCVGYINENSFLKYLYYNNTLLEIFSNLFR